MKEDPDNGIIIMSAFSSESRDIIMYGKHLLNLKKYEGIRIIRPEEARAIFFKVL